MKYLNYTKKGKDYETTIDGDKLQTEIERINEIIRVKSEEISEYRKEMLQLEALQSSLGVV